jgi:hypothetical protein
MPGCVDEMNDIWVAFQDTLWVACKTVFTPDENGWAHHDVDFLLDLTEHRLARDCNAFEDMVSRSVHCGGCPDEVDVCKAAYALVVTEAR